jgi:hypothetical protein
VRFSSGKIWLIIIGVFLIISSCGVKKNLEHDQYLLNKYKIKIEGKHPEISSSELKTLLSPTPNKKLLFARNKLWVYYRYVKNKTKFNTWLNEHFGEEPVFYSEKKVISITTKMNRYLDNIGFFNSTVTYKEDLYKNVANIAFNIKPAEPYRISKIKYEISDTLLKSFFYDNIKESLIKENNIYNAYTFDNERDRISQNLRNSGYYYFNRNYIQFVVDSNLMKHSMDINLVINNLKTQDNNSPGEFTEENHRRYFINAVTIVPEFNPANTINYDTIFHKIDFWKDTNNYTYYILYNKNTKQHILPSAFNAAIKIKPEEPFSALKVQNTYRKLFNYQIIQTANITFDTANIPNSNKKNHNYLNSRIQLRNSNLNRFSAELEGTNSSGDMGIRGSLVFLNKNIFKKAEVLRIRLKGGFEAQTTSSSSEGSNGIFNTFETGIDGTIFFPRFLSPIRLNHFNQKYIPNTNLNFGFNYQQRPYYSRNITNLDIGYTWKAGKNINHILTPININYVKINPTEAFADTLANEPNRRLREQYSDHMIVGMKYSFTFNNQNMKVFQHFNYLRVDLESSGNLLYGINSLTNSQKNDSGGYYSVFGVRYSQFIRVNIDFRHYYYFANETNALVSRIILGVGVPYLNSDELPYEKGFYAGGANDMRGWLFKTLGPGAYSGDSPYEKVGDIQIEGNLEYRFPIYNFFKGALFVDIGNIWTYNTSESFPGGKFYFNKFVSQLAVDVGFGFRFDFKVLIFRIDPAIPVRNPAYPSGSMWRIKYLQPTDIVWNFGIGYPF